ncbi:MAG: right-handed parallel beta-helix repeat-containing protein [Anaerolineae bacterium]|nr:right-handed parallel beta-helix repeat-containing protein [Anaerolineae bacterium]
MKKYSTLAAIFLLLAGAVIPVLAQDEPALVETFSEPALPGWDYTSGVTAANGRLQISAPGIALYDDEWAGDLTFSVWARRSGAGAVVVSYHASRLDAYLVAIYGDRVTLARERGGVEAVEAPFAVPDGAWFQLGVAAAGETHTVLVDGNALLTLTDPGGDLAGGIGFEATGEAAGEFDDLIVMHAALTAGAQPLPTAAPASPERPAAEPAALPGECTRYLAAGGSDDGDGSQAQPWHTFEHANTVAQPGDVICAAAGDYTDQGMIHLTTSGSDGAPITYTTYDGGAALYELVIDFDVSHLRLHGFTVQGYEVWGVTISGGNEDIALSGLDVGGGEAGVRITYQDNTPVDGVTLADSVIHDTVYSGVDCTPGPCNNMVFRGLEIYGAGLGEASYAADGLSVEKGAYILVEDCYIHDNSGDGIDLNSRDDGTMPGIVVRGNRVFNSRTNGIKLWNGGEASYNVVWNTGDTLLVLEPGDYTIANNTFASMNGYSYLAVLGGYEETAPATIRLHNNIFYNDNPAMGATLIYFAPDVTLEADYNLYYNPYRENDVICRVSAAGEECFSKEQINDGTWSAATGQDEHSLYADPVFTDAANGDFHLTAASPLGDAGAYPYGGD